MASPRYVLSPEALDDLAAIAEYIASRSGTDRASRVVDRISRAISAISFAPNAGRGCPNLDGEPLLFPVRPWLILYEPKPDLAGIYVLRVFDGRRDLPEIFRSYKRPSGKARPAD
jgi:plasmid stabilization system protein ParE